MPSPRWPDLVERAITLLRAQTRIAAASPRPAVDIRHHREIHARPAAETIAWFPVANRMGDGNERVLLQLTIWADGLDKVLEIETAIRQALDRKAGVSVSGLTMLAWFDDGRDGGDPEPGASERSVDYYLEAVWKN